MLFVFLFVASFLLLFGIRSNWLKKDRSVVGSVGILGSYMGALRYIFDARGMIKEGYEKYRGSFCKIPTFRGWVILVNDPVCIEALAKMHEGLSFREAVVETFQTDYLLARSIRENPYHVDLVRGPVTRNVNSCIPAIQRTVRDTVIEPLISGSGDAGISVFLLAKQLVQSASGRIFYGPSSDCTVKLNRTCESFTNNLIIASHVLKLFPHWLKSLVPYYSTGVQEDIKNSSRLLGDIISDPSRNGCSPKDTVLELLTSTQDPTCINMEELTTRLLIMKMTADHSTTQALSFLLYDLATHPEEVSVMRGEVEAAVGEIGWSREAFKRMDMLDSFMKESQRLSPLGAYVMVCKATKDVVFPDGTVVPTGTMVAVPGSAILTCDDHYTNASQFKAWRFKSIMSGKHNLHTEPHHMVFGYGRRSCPGRTIALQIMKSITAQLILDYDIKLECDRFPPLYIGAGCVPDTRAKVVLGRRPALKPVR